MTIPKLSEENKSNRPARAIPYHYRGHYSPAHEFIMHGMTGAQPAPAIPALPCEKQSG